MAAASVDDPIRGEDEDRIQIITELYRPLLIQVLNVKDIIEHVKIQFSVEDVMFTEVLELIETGTTPRSTITERFIDALAKKEDKRGLYRAVIDALYKTDDAIAKHLEGTCDFNTKKREHYRSFLWLYAQRLENIEPLDLLPSLENHLTTRDREEIRRKAAEYGNCAGASELLLRLDRKSEECFEDFIKALYRNGLSKLAEEMEGMKNFALGIGADEDEDMDIDSGEAIPVVGKVSAQPCQPSDDVVKLELHDFQEEVLTPALMGQNVMVVLPTGKGKTEVAIALIDRRFLERDPIGATNHHRQKSVFVVNKVPLVKQQKDRCLKYLRGRCDVAGASGEELNHVPLDIVIDNNDITVLTAQVLVNALNDPNIKLTLSDIALLILDECHHCQKSDPYNVLMAMYRDLKLNSPKRPRPQILGLTASPGVGDSKNMVQAKDYITKLCANLDCRISRPKIYTKTLSGKTNSPEEISIIMKGRSLEDRYFIEISVIMERIEEKIKRVEAGRALIEENEEFSNMESRRGTQSYEQGVSNLRKKIQSQVENDDRRELMTCVSYLREYNNSLFVNRDARTSDAISYMEDYINEEERSSPSGPADMLLKNMFRDKLGSLNRIAELDVSINPVLNELGEILKREYAKKKDSLSIIFTRTRESAKALVKWLHEDPDLRPLNAKQLIGGGGSDGMTSTEQNRNLQHFKEEKCRILVATSVAEEGLDIQKCNLVFRYNYVTSDVGHLQTKGRSRANFHGKIYVIVNSDLQLQDRELKNIIRVKMMNEAVQGIAGSILDNQKAFDDQILLEQKIDQQERQRKKEFARITKANKVKKSGILLHCNHCFREACSLDDIRIIRNQDHVVMNDLFLGKMKLVDLKKQPVINEFKLQQEIHCANCQHKWGTMVVYQQQELPLIAVKKFTFKDSNDGSKRCFKTWKEVPYEIRSINLEDLGKQSNVADEQQGGDQKKEEDGEDNGLIEFYPNIEKPD